MTHVKWNLTTAASAGKGLQKARRDARTPCSWSGRCSRITVLLYSLQCALPIFQRCQKLLRKADSTLRGSRCRALLKERIKTLRNLLSCALASLVLVTVIFSAAVLDPKTSYCRWLGRFEPHTGNHDGRLH